MKIYKQIIGAGLITLGSLGSTAQTAAKEVNTQEQGWFSINSTVRLTDKFAIVADVHVRRNDFLARDGFYFARLGASYWITKNLVATAGYAHMWVAPSKKSWEHFANEHRVYQQLQLNSGLGKVSMMQRFRNEQRWQEKIAEDQFTGKYKFTNRLRYLLSFTVPVFKNPQLPKVVVADELAIQFGKEIIYNTFDQNRIFLGVRQQVCKPLAFDFGYMQVYQQKASGYQYDKNHTLRLFLYYTPDLRAKKQG